MARTLERTVRLGVNWSALWSALVPLGQNDALHKENHIRRPQGPAERTLNVRFEGARMFGK